MWRKPWIVSVNNERGRVVRLHQYIQRKSAVKRFRQLAKEYTDCTVSMWHVDESDVYRCVMWKDHIHNTKKPEARSQKPKENHVSSPLGGYQVTVGMEPGNVKFVTVRVEDGGEPYLVECIRNPRDMSIALTRYDDTREPCAPIILDQQALITILTHPDYLGHTPKDRKG